MSAESERDRIEADRLIGQTDSYAEENSNPWQTVLPGYGRDDFEGLLLKPAIDERIFKPRGTPAYDFEDLSPLKPEKVAPGTTWEVADPTSMYVSSLAWVAYPYGIPCERQPCPYGAARALAKRPEETASPASSSFASSSSSSISLDLPDKEEPAPPATLEIQQPLTVERTPHFYTWAG